MLIAVIIIYNFKERPFFWVCWNFKVTEKKIMFSSLQPTTSDILPTIFYIVMTCNLRNRSCDHSSCTYLSFMGTTFIPGLLTWQLCGRGFWRRSAHWNRQKIPQYSISYLYTACSVYNLFVHIVHACGSHVGQLKMVFLYWCLITVMDTMKYNIYMYNSGMNDAEKTVRL